jgi:hypothetical protein
MFYMMNWHDVLKLIYSGTTPYYKLKGKKKGKNPNSEHKLAGCKFSAALQVRKTAS